MMPDWMARSAVQGQAVPLKLSVKLSFTLLIGSFPV